VMVGIYHSRWRAVAARGTRQFTADRRSGGLVILPVEHYLTHVSLRFIPTYSRVCVAEGYKENIVRENVRVEFQ